MHGKLLLRCLAPLLLFAVAALPAQAKGLEGLKIGVVNVNEALNQSAAGERSKSILLASKSQLENELKAKEADLKKKHDDLQNNIMLTKEARQAKEQALRDQENQLRKDVQDAQRELQDKERKLTQSIYIELRTVIGQIAQEEHYDLVIDAQGLIKSGIISRISRGLTVGLSNHTIREPLATLFYNVVYTVPWQQHAVERVRDLFSRTFNYSLEHKSCDYGIDVSRFMETDPVKENTIVFFHGTTWDSKKWPVQYWQKLARIAESHGMKIKLSWGNQEELARAQKIASSAANVEILNDMSLTDIAITLVRSRAVVAVDTGLAHLAAALGVPVVSIYGSSDPELTGTYGRGQLHLKSSLSCSPCLNKTCQYNGKQRIESLDNQEFSVIPACYGDNPPDLVWDKVQDLMEGGRGSLDGLFYS